MSLTGRTEQQLTGTTGIDSYYPPLTNQRMVLDYRLPAEFNQDLVTSELLAANIRVNEMLASYKAKYATFDAPLGNIKDANNSALFVMYQRAVFCLARAYIGRHYITLGSREANKVHADVDDNEYSYWHGEHVEAVDYILRTFVTYASTDDTTNALAQSAELGGYMVQTI